MAFFKDALPKRWQPDSCPHCGRPMDGYRSRLLDGEEGDAVEYCPRCGITRTGESPFVCIRCGEEADVRTLACPLCLPDGNRRLAPIGASLPVSDGPDEATLRQARADREPVAFRLQLPGYGQPEKYGLVPEQVHSRGAALLLQAHDEHGRLTVRGAYNPIAKSGDFTVVG